MGFLEFKNEQLQENSLYTNQAEKDALMADKEKIMDALMLNFFGFLGLFKLSSGRAPLKKYEQTEKSLFPTKIGDDNHDTSLVIKLAADAGLIQSTAINSMTKLLSLIKMKKIKDIDLNEDMVRDILKTIHYGTHKPSMRVKLLVDKFANKEITLGQFAFEANNLGRMKEYKGLIFEFRKIIKDGQYYNIFQKMTPLDQQAQGQTPGAAPAVVSSTPSTPTAPGVKTRKYAFKSRDFWSRVLEKITIVHVNMILAKFSMKPEDWTYEQRAVDLMDAIKEFPDLFTIAGLTRKTGEAFFIRDLMKNVHESHLEKFAIAIFNSRVAAKPESFEAELASFKEFLTSYGKTLTSPVPDAVFNALVKEWKNAHTKEDAKKVFSEIIYPVFKWFPLQQFDLFESTVIDSFESAVKFRSVTRTNTHDDKLMRFAPSGFVQNTDAGSKDETPIIIPKHVWDVMPQTQKDELKKWDGEFQGYKVEEVAAETPEIAAIKSATDLKQLANISYTRVDTAIMTNTDVAAAFNLKFMELFHQMQGNADRFKQLLNQDQFEIRWMFSRCPITDVALGIMSVSLDSVCKNLTFEQIDIFIGWMMSAADKDKLISIRNTLDSKGLLNNLKQWAADWFNTGWAGGKKIAALMQVIPPGGTTHVLDHWFKTGGHYSSLISILNNVPVDMSKMFNEETSDDTVAFIAKVLDFDGVADYQQDQIISGLAKVNKTLVSRLKVYLKGAVHDGLYRKFLKKSMERGVYEVVDDDELQMMTDAYCGLGDPDDNRDSYISGLKETSDERVVAAINKSLLKMFDTKNTDGYSYTLTRFGAGEIVERLSETELSEAQKDGVVHMLQNTLLNGTRSWNGKFYDSTCKVFPLLPLADNRVFTSPHTRGLMDMFAKIIKTPSILPREYRESVQHDISGIFASADVTPETEACFAMFDKDAQKKLGRVYANSIMFVKIAESVKNDQIPITGKITKKSANTMMKINNIEIPADLEIDYRKPHLRGKNLTLAALKSELDSISNGANVVQKQAITKIEKTVPQLMRMAVEYDKMNSYRHGGITMKFLETYEVNIPRQEAEFPKWREEHKDSPTYKFFDTQFHGTTELSAAMISRYGFAIITKALAQEAGIKYAGRMLGDGVYSSNVLDKTSQYMGNGGGGITRKFGTIGYLFEMETQGDKWVRGWYMAGNGPDGVYALGSQKAYTGDYTSAKQGTATTGGSSMVSPEWAWQDPHGQCRITKVHKVELMSSSWMENLKAKVSTMNESDEKDYKSFAEYLSEAKRVPAVKEKVKYFTTYTFMDGFIPVAKDKLLEIDEFTKKFPNVRVEFVRDGVTVAFEVNSFEDAEDYKFLHGVDVTNSVSKTEKFLAFLKKAK